MRGLQVWRMIFRAAQPLGKRLLWVFHQLWHEITGSLFLVMALGALPALWTHYRAKEWGYAALAGTFMLTMLYFGVTAFARARRIRHQGAPS